MDKDDLLTEEDYETILYACLKGLAVRGIDRISEKDMDTLFNNCAQSILKTVIDYSVWQLIKKGKVAIAGHSEEEGLIFKLIEDNSWMGKEIEVGKKIIKLKPLT